MFKEFSFKKGLAETIRLIEKVERRPTLVGVYGPGNSGKSYLIDKLGEYFEGKGLRVSKLHGSAGPEFFEFIKRAESEITPERRIQLYFFHVCSARLKEWPEEDDPNCLAEKILGRGLDLNFGVYNPKFVCWLSGDYDVIIRNPSSVMKDAFSDKTKSLYTKNGNNSILRTLRR